MKKFASNTLDKYLECKSNYDLQYCNNDRCKKTTKHKIGDDGSIICENCGTNKKVVKKNAVSEEAQKWISNKIEYLIKVEKLTPEQAAGKAYGMAREKGFDIPKTAQQDVGKINNIVNYLINLWKAKDTQPVTKQDLEQAILKEYPNEDINKISEEKPLLFDVVMNKLHFNGVGMDKDIEQFKHIFSKKINAQEGGEGSTPSSDSTTDVNSAIEEMVSRTPSSPTTNTKKKKQSQSYNPLDQEGVPDQINTMPSSESKGTGYHYACGHCSYGEFKSCHGEYDCPKCGKKLVFSSDYPDAISNAPSAGGVSTTIDTWLQQEPKPNSPRRNVEAQGIDATYRRLDDLTLNKYQITNLVVNDTEDKNYYYANYTFSIFDSNLDESELDEIERLLNFNNGKSFGNSLANIENNEIKVKGVIADVKGF